MFKSTLQTGQMYGIVLYTPDDQETSRVPRGFPQEKLKGNLEVRVDLQHDKS